MERAEQLEWEARTGRPAAIAAVLSVLAFVAAGIYLQAGLDEQPEGEAEELRLFDENSTELIASGVIQAVALFLLIPVLGYLYRVTRFRRSQLPKAALVLAVAGPVLVAVVTVVQRVVFTDLAGDFVGGSPLSDERAESIVEDSAAPVLSGFVLAGNLALGFAILLLALHAMRAGLMSRFIGILGIIVGVLYALPIGGGASFIQFFWLGALAALFFGRWPGGRGPAWEAGEAVPWPSAAEQARQREREQGVAGDGGEQARERGRLGGGGRRPGGDVTAAPSAGAEPELEAGSVDPDTPRKDPRPSSRKRKRKKRKR